MRRMMKIGKINRVNLPLNPPPVVNPAPVSAAHGNSLAKEQRIGNPQAEELQIGVSEEG